MCSCVQSYSKKHFAWKKLAMFCDNFSSQVGYGDILPYTQAEYLICTTCRLDLHKVSGGSPQFIVHQTDFWSSKFLARIFGHKHMERIRLFYIAYFYVEKLYSNAGLFHNMIFQSLLGEKSITPHANYDIYQVCFLWSNCLRVFQKFYASKVKYQTQKIFISCSPLGKSGEMGLQWIYRLKVRIPESWHVL